MLKTWCFQRHFAANRFSIANQWLEWEREYISNLVISKSFSAFCVILLDPQSPNINVLLFSSCIKFRWRNIWNKNGKIKERRDKYSSPQNYLYYRIDKFTAESQTKCFWVNQEFCKKIQKEKWSFFPSYSIKRLWQLKH